VNVLGTQRLLEACVGHDVRRIVYISSIAAGYADLSGYPYGRTKLEAETLVRRSPLEHVVLRPTIVLGERGPTWTMLRKLACLPFVPVFAGGRTEVQPVDVADVARGVAALLDDFQPKRTIDLGGPEVVTFGNLLRRIRRACGHAGGLLVPIPLWPVRSLLDLANVMLPGRLPVGAAQLVPFVQDGKAQPSSLYEQLRPSMTSLDALLFRIAHAT
jgi:NADH dehydrogenase